MTGIQKGEDGVYRWGYEVNLLKNPTILLVVWKILALCFGGVWLFTSLLSVRQSWYTWAEFWKNTKVFALITAALLALAGLAYLLYAAIMGGKYCVVFEMDEKGVKHTQLARQVKKAELLGVITALVGLASKNPGTMGAGLLAGSRTALYSDFSRVKKLKAIPRRNVIKVNAPLSKNQVYAEDGDFDFVLEFIENATGLKA